MHRTPSIVFFAPWLALAAGSVLRADTLFLSSQGGSPGDQVSAGVELLNEQRIVGLQFDLKVPAGQAVPSAALVAEGMDRHRLSSRWVDGRLKVVVHSPTNADLPSAEILSIPLSLSSSAPEGGPSFSVENLIFTNAAGQTVSGAVFYHPLETWRQERFTEEQREDPEIVGDFKDPDGDGFTNIMEFLFATDPLAADAKNTAGQSLGRRSIPVPDGDPIPGPVFFSFDFPRAKGVDGVDLWIETSTDLVNWTRESVEPVRTGGSDSVTERMRLVIESDPKVITKRFFRLGVARKDDAVPQPGFVPKVSYADWIARSYLGADLANLDISGEQADPDGDHIVNLMEYLFGSDPKVASTTVLPSAGLILNGGIKTAELKYGVSREAEGAYLVMEASPDLETWAPAGFSTVPTGRASASTVEISAKVDGVAPERQFFRFQVVREP